MIELNCGNWRAIFEPSIGGSLTALERAGVPVLRQSGERVIHPLQTACFPMVPYCNRIARGRFVFAGAETSIAANLEGELHPLHGTGWLRAWRIVRLDSSSVLLEDDYRHGEGDWPWPYRAHQHVALDANGMTIWLIAENRAGESAPMGLGMHPYFRRRPEAAVAIQAMAMLGIDDEFLPDGTAQEVDALAPFSTGAAIPPVLVDNCFTGWTGSASIRDDLGTIVVRGFGATCVHVYASPDGSALCLEPVNHPPDALNRAPGAMTVLPPGAAAGIAMRIEAG